MPEASGWADRLVALAGADPRALVLRGELEVRLNRPDRALPWYLWAAYTTGVGDPQAPGQWSRLASLYGAFGWHDHAREVTARAGGTYQEEGKPPDKSDLVQRTGECRQWHDWLIDYRPETLIRETGEDWQSVVEDLEAWHVRCSFAEPDPFATGSGDCQPRSRPLPRTAARFLAEGRRGYGRKSRLDSLRCIVAQAVFLPPEIESLMPDPKKWGPIEEDPALWQLRGTIHLRLGRLAEALTAWQKSLDLVSQEGDPGRLFERILEDLAQVQVRVLAVGGEDVGAALEAWGGALIKENFLGSRRALLLARVLMRWNPSDRATLDWVERAIVLSQGSSETLALRGQLELLQGRPDAALPWMTLAHVGTGSRSIDRGPLFAGLYGAYVGLRWWDRIDAANKSRTRETLAAQGLDLEEMLPPLLPAACPDLLDRLADQDITRLILSRGDRWQEHFTALKEWKARCGVVPDLG